MSVNSMVYPGALFGDAVFVVAGLAPPILLLFGAIDFSGAVGGWIALRAEFRRSPSQTV